MATKMRAQMSNASVRPPAVAGLFYPDDPVELQETVSSYLAHAAPPSLPGTAIGFIVPHAGYIYSGSTAGVAYRTLAERKDVRRIVLIGPSHRVYLEGIAIPKADVFATPLGRVPIDAELKAIVRSLPNVVESDDPHRFEHSLEVQLPFLQVIFGNFTLLPLVAGRASGAQVAAVLAEAAQDRNTLILASSDLSHYLTYERAQQADAVTNAAILRRDPTLTGEQACGAVPINGLLHLARDRGYEVKELARCNSGDTAGDRSRVVGYGAYAVYAA